MLQILAMRPPVLVPLGLTLIVLMGGCDRPPNPPSSLPSPSPARTLTDNWYRYQSPQGQYRAKFPAKPQEEKQAIATPQGSSELYLAIYEDPTNQRAYAISHNRVAAAAGQTLDIEKGLDASRDGIARGVDATVVQETPIRRGTYAGREIILAKANQMMGKARIFYTNGTLYQVFVLVQGQNLEQVPEVDAFLDSVELGKQ